MIIIGHRGAAGLAPENTIGSFKKAIELGVDGIEMDLRINSDGQIVVVHDPDPNKIYPGALKLSEVLASVNIPLNLEVKEAGFEKQLLETIKGFPSEILISSFKLKVLSKIRILDRNIRLGLIIAPKRRWNLLFVPIVLSSRFFLKLYSVNPHHTLLSQKRMQLLRKLNLKVFTWVINNTSDFETMRALAVDGVVTDYPDIIKR